MKNCYGLWINRNYVFNPSNAELNPICYLLALLGAHHFLHVSRIRVNIPTVRTHTRIVECVINMGTKVYNNLPKFFKRNRWF